MTRAPRPALPPDPPLPAPFAELPGARGAPVTLYQEDALEGLDRRIAPESAGVIVTSPPYNLGIRYGQYRDRRPREEYLDWMGRLGAAAARALDREGSFFLNVGGPPSDPGLPWAIAERVRAHLRLQNVIHWVKSIAIDRSAVGGDHGLSRDLVVGHYKPLRSDRYLHSAHEYIFHFTRSGAVRLDRLAIGVPYEDASNTRRWPGARRGLRCRGNTWFLPYPTIRRSAVDRPHPASFPPELPDRCLRLHGLNRVRLAVDPFVGIGSSAIAAGRLGIPFVGFDLDAGYLAEARRRLEAERRGARPPGPTAGRARAHR